LGGNFKIEIAIYLWRTRPRKPTKKKILKEEHCVDGGTKCVLRTDLITGKNTLESIDHKEKSYGVMNFPLK